jgi:hypothetical protein
VRPSLNSALLFAIVAFPAQFLAQAPEQTKFEIAADCECIGTRHYSACEIGWKPDVATVFVGEVTSRDHQQLGGVDTVTLSVKEVFRGSLAATVVVRAHTHLCSPWLIPDRFEEGKEYLVYATRGGNADLQLGSDAIMHDFHDFSESHSCSWKTVKLEDAPEELGYWRNISNTPDSGRVFGTAKKYIREKMDDALGEDSAYDMEPLPGKEIVVQGKEQTYRTQTDAKGKYEIGDLPPGSYEVFPADNPQEYLSPTKEHVEVAAKGCAQADFRDGTLLQKEFERKLAGLKRRKNGSAAAPQGEQKKPD